jgi:hypothetical protein
LSRLAWPIASWKSSSMNTWPLAPSLVRSFQEPLIPCTLSSRHAMPVVYMAYGTVCLEPASYHGSSKNV